MMDPPLSHPWAPAKFVRHMCFFLPRLPGSALKVPGGGGGGWWWWVASYPLLSQAPTRVEVELG